MKRVNFELGISSIFKVGGGGKHLYNFNVYKNFFQSCAFYNIAEIFKFKGHLTECIHTDSLFFKLENRVPPTYAYNSMNNFHVGKQDYNKCI